MSLKNLENLNFHHLYYFWVVANEGSVTAASERLGLAQPSVSSQVRKLESILGVALFEKSGRGRELSEVGRDVYRHADRIFGAGQQLIDYLNGVVTDDHRPLVVGVPDVMSKLVTFRLLEPVFRAKPNLEIICLDSRGETLLTDLAMNRFDVVLTHAPVGSHQKIQAYNHKLGECGLSFCVKKGTHLAGNQIFPQVLGEMPMLLPIGGTELRRSLDHWFDQQGIQPQVVGQFYDSALLKEFGSAGIGAFAVPSAIEQEVQGHYGVEVIGRVSEVRVAYYAVTTQRRVQHPGIMAIIEAARSGGLGSP